MRIRLRPLRLLLLISCLTGPSLRAHAAGSAEAAVVERWGIFELTLAGPSEGNPFVDVQLSAQFSQGDRRVTVEGFYDGEGVYKVRFSPETTGEWRYETASNRPALAGQRGAFTAGAPTGRNRGPVRVQGTFHFAYADGTPYRQIGTTSYSWIHRGDELELRTLRTLATSPFNKIRMCIFPQNRAAETIQLYPFEGPMPRGWDPTRFNPAFFRHLEERVGQLRDLGIEADLILFHPYGDRWNFSAMDAASDDRYVRYVVARLSAYRNVWWSLCNEWDFLKEKQESDWDRIFQVIQAADGHQRLRSIHNAFVIYNHTKPWVTHASIQQGAAPLDPERAVIYRDVYRKPIIYDEVKYEGNSPRRWGQLKAEELVFRFWNGTIAGTYVGHSEILGRRGADPVAEYAAPEPSGSGYWLTAGGELRGESAPRLAFLRQIMESGPVEGIEPIDKWQDRHTGGKAGEYYLVYFGTKTPREWPLVLSRTGLSAGVRFTAEVIDTWAMTITPVPGVFETVARGDYDMVDREGRSIPLPGRPYQAIRLRRVDAPNAPTAPAAAPADL